MFFLKQIFFLLAKCAELPERKCFNILNTIQNTFCFNNLKQVLGILTAVSGRVV